MYKIGDKLTLIKEIEYTCSRILYTLGNSYRIMNIKGNVYYLQNNEKSSNFKEWGIWNEEQLNDHFKNIRQERLEKLKQIDESTYRKI